MAEIVFFEDADLIQEEFAGILIFRPSYKAEIAVRKEVEPAMRKKHAVGTYTNAKRINQILQDYFCLYDKMLKALLPKVASRHLMEFVLSQYDQSCIIQHSKLNRAERDRWSELGPVFRRATKYLAECISMLAPDEAPEADVKEILRITEKCLICSEGLVRHSQLSTQTFALFPDATTLEIRDTGDLEWFILELNEAHRYEGYKERSDKDTSLRNKVIDEQKTLYNRERLARLIDPVFMSEFGMTFSDVLAFAGNVIEQSVVLDEGFDVPFVEEKQLADALTSDYGLTHDQAKVILNGLGLRRASMQEEGRVVWKPKQEYRAYFRPFIEFPHPTGTHFTWSREMAKECLFILFNRLAQKLVPREWNRGRLPKALGAYEQEITKLFEDIVIEQLRKVGVAASRFKSQIGLGAAKLNIPAEIGEIDLIGYLQEEELLIVGDDKLVKPGNEAAEFRDDLDKFLGKKKNYVKQIQRKAQWCIENVEAIGKALASTVDFPDSVSITKVAPILVTYYPSFADYFVSDVPVVALTELVSELSGNPRWPYYPAHKVRGRA